MKKFYALNFPAFARQHYLSVVFMLCLFSTAKVFAQVPSISYGGPHTLTNGIPITTLVPVNTGGTVPATVYGTTTILTSGFSNPYAIVTDKNGYAYVSDASNKIVKIRLSDGVIVKEITGINSPFSMDIDLAGNIYAVSPNSAYISKIHASDDHLEYIYAGVSAGGISIDGDGNIFVTGYYSGNLVKVSPAGGTQTIASGFTYPSNIVMDAAGNIYVADNGNNAIKKIAAGTWEVTTFFEVTQPEGLAIDAFGNFYITSVGTPNVTKRSVDGSITTMGTAYTMPYDVNLDENNDIFFTDLLSKTFRKVVNTGYTITPELPGGLIFDVTTGEISGTPSALSAPQNYTITAHNKAGYSTTTVNIGVLTPPPGISYNTPVVLNINVPASGITPENTGGEVASWTITPSLPDGLTFNSSTGVISGTPTALANPQNYTVTATNARGDGTATISLSVVLAAPITSYPASAIFTEHTAITPVNPSNTGGEVNLWSVIPALPSGLVFDAVTGIISGTPSGYTAAADYIITAENSAGSSTSTINIAVNYAAVAFSYTGPQAYRTNIAITPLSPVLTAGTPLSYSISPALPSGLNFNTTTGIISGTPTALLFNTRYTITATNTVANSTATVNISVLAQLPAISYGGPHAFSVGTTITPLTPTNSGGSVPATTIGTRTTITSSGLSNPYGIAIDGQGNYYIADYFNSRIVRIAGTGGQTVYASGYSFKNIAFNSEGILYFNDEYNIGKIVNGAVVVVTSIYNSSGLAIDASDNLYVNAVSDGVIKKIFPNGTITNIGSDFSTANAIAVDAQGNLYVTEASYHQLKKVSPAGELLATVTGVTDPYDVKVDPSGFIYTTYGSGGTILKISDTLETITQITSGLNYPYGLALDINGNIFTTEAGANRIRKIVNTGYSISATLPAGLSFNKTTGIISGTPTELSFMADYTITASNSSGSSKTVVRLGVPPPPPTISYASPLTFHQNKPVITIIPTIGGGSVSAFSIAPSLPAGLSFNTENGTITGTPTITAAATDYTVTAHGSADVPTIVNITILEELPTLSYTGPGIFTINTAILPMAPITSGPSVNVYSISPALPAGLNFDTSTGIISGTPTTVSSNIYIIGATANSGTSTYSLTIITKPLAPAIDYGTSLVFDPGIAITPLQPVNTGGAVPATSYGEVTNLGSSFTDIYGLAADAAGNVYVSEYGTNSLKKIAAADGAISVIGAGIVQPTGVVLDGKGNLYVADFGGFAIRKLVLETGELTTVTSGFAPFGITLDAAGNIYVNDYFNYVAKKVDVSDGTITSLGSGFAYSADLAVDHNGNVIVADSQNGMLKKVALNGTTTTIVSGLNWPAGVAIDPAGDLYFNSYSEVKKITFPDNIITNVASGFSALNDLTFDPAGNLYTSDGNGSIKKITGTGYSISPALPDGLIFDNKTGIITGTPIGITASKTYKVTAYNSAGSSTTQFNIEIKMTNPVISYTTPILLYRGITMQTLTPVNTGVAATAFSVSPALPDGITLDALTGMISGTPTTQSAASSYVITATNNSGSGTATIHITVMPPIPAFSYINPGKYPYGIAITPLQPLSVGGTVTQGYTISPALPTGLSLNAATGVISGTPAQSIELTTFTVTATNADGTGTATVKLKVGVPPPVISYASPKYYLRNTAITALSPANTGGAVPLTSGEITVVNNSFPNSYGIAIDKEGFIYAPFNTDLVKVSPDDGSYTVIASDFTNIYDVAVDAAGNLYVADAGVTDIKKIAPNGVISIIATGFSSPGAITVDKNGNVFVADLSTLEIKKIAASDGAVTTVGTNIFSYGLVTDDSGNVYATQYQSTRLKKITPSGTVSNFGTGFSSASGIAIDDEGIIYVLNEGTAQIKKVTADGTVTTFRSSMNGVAMDINGGEYIYLMDSSVGGIKRISLLGYSVSPALPAGLSISASTGVISGTPTTATASKTYTITAKNDGGKATADITIAVATPSATLATVPANGVYVTAQYLTFSVTFNIPVTVTGSPYITLTLNSGGTTRASYYQGSGTATLTFRYLITATNVDDNGIAVASSITLNSGTIKDSGNNNATLTSIPFAATTGVLVNYSPQTITFNTLTAKTYGDQNFTLVATGGGSGNAVTFASNNNNVATISGNTLTIVGAGTANITASQAGNTNYSAATPVIRTLTVNKATQTLTFAALGAKTFGDANFSLAASSTAPANPLVYTSSNTNVATVTGNVVHIVSPGSTDITVSQAATSNYTVATPVTQTLVVNKVIAQLFLSGLSADYDGNAKNVVITSNPEDLTGITVTYDGSLTAPILPGTYEVVASLNNSYYSANPVTVQFTINKIAQVLSLSAFGAKNLGDADFDAAVTSTNSGIPITLSSTNFSVATIVNGKIHINGPGTTTITASQGGNELYSPAADVSQTLSVTLSSNANLADLTISAGTLSQAFTESLTSYSTSVPYSVSTISLTPTVAQFMAETQVKINSGTYIAVQNATPSIPLALNVGVNIIDIAVTAADGTVKNYQLSVTRALSNETKVKFYLNPNSTLVVAAGSNNNIINYTTSVDHNTQSITIQPVATAAGTTIVLNGSAILSGATSQPVALNVGATTITALVTAPDGVTSRTYTITVTRTGSNNAEARFNLDPNSTLVTTSGPANVNYNASVDAATTAITITPVAQDANAVVRINGNIVPTGAVSEAIPLGPGVTTINASVAAQDGTTIKTYAINITRAGSNNAEVKFKLSSNSSLVLSTGQANINYISSVDFATSNVTVIPTAQDVNANIVINGEVVSSGSASSPILLGVGATVVNVTVTAQNGTSVKTYSITITRNGSNNAEAKFKMVPNSALVLSTGTAYMNYTTSVDFATSSVMLIPDAQDDNATITINGNIVANGAYSTAIPLNPGATVIQASVTAQDGTTVKTYAVTVNRTGSNNAEAKFKLNPNSTLELTTGTGYLNYFTSVAGATTSVNVTPSAQDANAVITINGHVVATGTASPPIPLSAGNTLIPISITAQDGITVKTYTITVARSGSNNAEAKFKLNPNSILVVSGAGANSVSYTTSVDALANSVTLTPTTQDANAVVRINGNIVSTGTASLPVLLNVGETVITATVTAENGTVKTSTITVHRNGSNNADFKYRVANAGVNLITGAVTTTSTSYTVEVANAISSLILTPAAQDANATIVVNGNAVPNGVTMTPFPLNIGTTTITAVVTAQDGVTVKTYTIVVTRQMPDAGRMSASLTETDALFKNDISPALNKRAMSAGKPEIADVITIPNAISPNGDGANDELVVNGLDNFPENKLVVMNRNGTPVFETTNYQNSSRKFDGKSPNGDRLPTGTYFYRLTYKDGKQTKLKRGFITVMY